MKINKLILKKQQKFRSEKYNGFTDEINKIQMLTNDSLSSNDSKRMQLIDSIETYAYE